MVSMFVLLPVLALLLAYLHHRLFSSRYWARKGVEHLEPNFLIGNFWRVNFTENFGQLLEKWHRDNKAKKILGLWMFRKPVALLTDLNLIKRILIKDFNSFRDRGMEFNGDNDPLAAHLFVLSGVEWRNLRVKLTPTFTSGKMKMMFPTMVKTGLELEKYLEAPATRGEVLEVKDVLARYTTDIISSCAFGINANSLWNPASEFREFGRRIFNVDLRFVVLNLLRTLQPWIVKALGIRVIPKDISDFFINAVKETVEERERTQTTRKDFLQLIIQLMRAGKVEDVDKKVVDSDGLDDEALVQKFTLNQAAAQCFVFFGAGFETSSTALTFALYELALNPDIQSKLQNEIDEVISGCGEELTYEALTEMEYLDMVVHETLRKHPPVVNLQRISGCDYDIPELNLKIDKGTILFISVSGIQHDPELYPDPERFDPYRFSSEEKAKRDPAAFMPFGEGPRNCIGSRFGVMQVKVGLVYVLRRYSVAIAKETPIPVVYELRAFVPTPLGGMPLALSVRK